MRRTALFLVLLMWLGAPAFAAEVRVSAAASLTDALDAVCSAWAESRRGARCAPNYGASGTLAKQIAQGAPADLFISADPAWMEFLKGEGRLSPEGARNLAGNRLVFLGRPGRGIASLADLGKLERIALGSPGSVPAGRYAVEALRKAGLYERLLGAGKLVMAQDVRQALLYADRGEADGAFVYRTDAPLARNAKVLFEVPPALHTPISYPMALTAQGGGRGEALAFFRYLQGPEARRILGKHGFVLP